MEKRIYTSGEFMRLPEKKLMEILEKECLAISKHFSSEQIDKLEVDLIDGQIETKCIYGRMVGNCNSYIVKSFIDEHVEDIVINNIFFTNGLSFEKTDPKKRSIYYMTPVETYIFPDEFLDVNGDETYTEDYVKRVETVINLIKNVKN